MPVAADTPQRLSQLDSELAALALEESALRLRLGQVLEVLGRGAHFELGFPSLATYALERCERSVRWVDAARCLARRLEALPSLRRAVAFGAVSWSKGEILVRVATRATEAAWLEAAQGCTVRELRARVQSQVPSLGGAEAGTGIETDMGDADMGDADMACESDEDACTLTCTVDREQAWLFEATRALLEQLGERSTEEQVEALLAEGQCTLLAALPRSEIDVEALDVAGWHQADTAQQRWREQLGRFRAQAELWCEERFRAALTSRGTERAKGGGTEWTEGGGTEWTECVGAERAEGVAAPAMAAALGCGALEGRASCELDALVRDLSRRLARHELVFSQCILRFHREDGWRRLGYATEAQYARERLGLSRSSMIGRRGLALRLERLPRVADALSQAQMGVEAAIQIVRVATPCTELAWLDRARVRTIKHLREEVSAAQVALRLSGEVDCPPPSEAELSAFQELERAVISGRACQGGNGEAQRVEGTNGDAQGVKGTNGDAQRVEETNGDAQGVEGTNGAAQGVGAMHGAAERCSPIAVDAGPRQSRAWRVMLSSLAAWLAGGLRVSPVQMSAAGDSVGPLARRSSAGRVELRLRVSRSTYLWWRGLEAQARRWLPCRTSFLSFLCSSMWRAWQHLLGADMAYGAIYLRDRFRCRSPVCNRRDVTPHHLRFRSAGGSDADENVVAVCSWCHLFGVHGGRIRARGTAAHVRWELGPRANPCLVVHGRRRVAA